MADALFENRRLANLYDPLNPDRSDLDAYVALAGQTGARSVLDIGCGTGTLACRLARAGNEVIAVDPAAASLSVARRKPSADRVRWIAGDVSELPPLQVDLATMTGNVAQVFSDDEDWVTALLATRRALRPGGLLAFETRDPERNAWREWTRAQTLRHLHIPEVGGLKTWVELTEVELPLVSFRATYVFESDGAVLTSDSTLRFRSRPEVEDSLTVAGFSAEDVRDAPDRPGRELVFLARTPRNDA